MTAAVDQKLYQFADFVLDTRRATLSRGDSEIKLRPQSYNVLRILLEKNGELVSRDELHEKIWADRAVTDDSLAQCVVEIRRALDDTAREIIRTVPRRGFIFDGDVDVQYLDGPEALRLRRSTVLQGAGLLVTVGIVSFWIWSTWFDEPPPQTIAVLPFIDMSAEQDLKHIGDGLAEDILNTLAHRQDLGVIARTSSFAYSTELRDIETIGDALDVAYVLEGSVRRDKDVYRVVAQLIETGDSTHVWSESFEIAVQDLPYVHEQISRQVWRELRPASVGNEEVVIHAGISASEQMMLARQYEVTVRELPEVNVASLDRAIELYRDATETNPRSAVAFAGLARALLFKGDVANAKLAVDSALLINPDSSDVQEVLGRLRWITASAGAGEAWRRATELNPGSADAAGAYGYWLWMQGLFDSASEQLYRAKEKDPGSLSRYADLGNFLGNEARIVEVDALVEEIQARFDSAESYRVIARLLDLVGRVDESIAWLLRAQQKNPDEPKFRWALAELFVDIGDFDTALKLEPNPSFGLLLKMGRYEEFIETAEMAIFDRPDDVVLQYLLAFAYNVVGKHEQAVWLLDRTRVAETVQFGTRSMWDLEAVFTWLDANAQLGNTEKISSVVDYVGRHRRTQSANWWAPVYEACTASSLGDEDFALDELQKLFSSPRLPSLYLVRDAGCFQKFVGQPRYESVLDDIRSRQREIRARLPGTVERFGVSLP